LFKDEEAELQSVITQYFVRGLRLIAFFVSVFLPGLYVAILTVNTTIVPGLLAIAIAASRQSIAFPIFTETLILLVAIDIMAEATASMKGVLGPAISIVGTLIIGQAIVRANLGSNLGVILIALTALTTYITPRYFITYAYRIWKYPILFLSGILGIMGWTIGALLLTIHLASIRTLGISYLAPAAPLQPRDLARESAFGYRSGAGAARMFHRRRGRT
jgi:spore germination protein KA